MVPTPLIFLAACLLLVTRIPPTVCRAVDLKIFDKREPNVNTATDEENDTPLIPVFGTSPKYMMIRSQLPPDYLQMVKDIFAKEATRFLRELSLNTKSLMSTQEADQKVSSFRRTSSMNYSLDLTFKLLLELNAIAKLEWEHKVAASNRKIMDKIGK
ncbi:UI-like isoform X1 [Scyliorhinus torazame]|uniref:UI-like isoform X1 n=1 Tax=Scyliorhinus torazame TaxID=75743 RepID=UPI003B5A88E1